MSANTPLNAALTALMTSEAEYVEKLAAVRKVIAALREVLGIETPAAPPASVTRTPRAKSEPGRRQLEPESDAPAEVLRALHDGPILVSDFLKKTKLSRYQAQQLVKRGVIVATGTTNSRRYGLPGKPAKEAP